MSEAREPLRRIVVAGSGQVGLASAIALRRALPRCQVLLLGTDPDPLAFADAAATALPFTNKLHDRLGIEEIRLVLQAGGSHRLGTRYLGWGGEGQQGMLTYGAPEASVRTAFIRDWGGGAKNTTGRRRPGALAEVLADAGRFAVPPRDRDSPLSEVDYALRWSVGAYRDLLAGLAKAVGVDHVPGRIGSIAVDAHGGIASLSVEGGRAIEADLFVDCCGAGDGLLSRLSQFRWQDWRDVLPTRRIFTTAPGEPMVALEDRVSLLPEGWLSEFAGRDGLQIALGVGDWVDDTAVAALFGGQHVTSLALSQGRVRVPWIGNVIAIGDAAARFEPLGNFNLDLAHRQLALLLEMLPGRLIEPLEREEYNRRSGLMMDGVRDTLAMHFAAPHARSVFRTAIPDCVAASLDQFERRGRVPFREEAPFLAQEYMALLGALGFSAGQTPQMRSTTDREVALARQEFDRKARAALEFAPGYGEWLMSVQRPAQAQRE